MALIRHGPTGSGRGRIGNPRRLAPPAATPPLNRHPPPPPVPWKPSGHLLQVLIVYLCAPRRGSHRGRRVDKVGQLRAAVAAAGSQTGRGGAAGSSSGG